MTEAMAPPSTKAPYALDDHYAAHYAPEGWEVSCQAQALSHGPGGG